MRILISSSSYAPALNGQSMFTTNLAEGMAHRGHEVWVLTPSEEGTPYHTVRNGVHVQAVRAYGLAFLHDETYLALLPEREVRKLFKFFDPDIIHLQDHFPLSNCVLRAGRRLKKKQMGTNHFMPDNLAPYVPLLPKIKPLFDRLLWGWMEWTYNSLDLVTAPSRTAAEIMRGAGVRVTVVPVSCGVSFERFHPDSSIDRRAIRLRYGMNPDVMTFLFVGRVDAEKHVEVLIRAVKLLDRKDFQLVVAGQGAARPAFITLASDLGVENQVLFPGFVPNADLPALLNSVEFFAMPSEAELLSIASLEAMATGLPLLVARCKALPELVADGVNGYLFEPGDPKDAARCMSLLLDDPQQWATMGAASLEKVKPHSLENVLARYEELYSQLLNAKKL